MLRVTATQRSLAVSASVVAATALVASCARDRDVATHQQTALEATQISYAELYDYYVQDVCLDANGAPTTDDPYYCASRRNMVLDEPVRFWPTDASWVQATFSAPFRVSPDDSIGVLHPFDFGNAPNINGSGHDAAFREFTPWWGNLSATSHSGGWPIDGYDVLAARGGYASYVGTCDGGGGVQAFVHWSGGPGTCETQDGWLLWDQNRLDATGSVAYDAVGTLRIESDANGWSCPTDFMNDAYTWWQIYDVTYTSGKTMQTLMSTHFNGSSPDQADSFERFYYTKPYGRTRWEAFNRTPRADGYTGNCNGPTYDAGYGMYRVDCRDWSTNGMSDPDGGWYPQAWPVDYGLAKGNWLVNGDFGEANFGYFGRWNNTNDNNPSWAYSEETPGGIRQYNHFMTAQLTLGAGSINQDVQAPGVGYGWWFQFGARVWADQPNSPATLVIWEFGTDGTSMPIAAIPINAGPDARPQYFGAFMVDRPISALRWELYLGSGNVYHIDDAFLTQT
jgi:hypothetical protein